MDSFGYELNSDDIFLEEQDNLNEKLDAIEAIINKLDCDINKYKSDCDEYKNDYENIRYFIESQNKYAESLKEMNLLKKRIMSPYFGHMYLTEKNEDEDIFIGEESITDLKGENIVYDWRSPVCSLYYANQNFMKYKNYTYNVKFKRQLLIQNKEMVSCDELYNSQKDVKVTDAFLKSVLKEKKEITGFTDIIKTIQSKQNEIIRNDIDKNIICQGVAGSGKTVIIIHRLSYLLFNNPSIRPTDFLFIAPNDNFKKELSELNIKLQIDKIKLKTLYEYYVEKFNKYFNLSEKEIYEIKNVVDDVGIDVEVEYSNNKINEKYKIIEDFVLTNINDIANQYRFDEENVEFDSCIDKGRKLYSFLVERIKKYNDLSKFLKENIYSILKKYNRVVNGNERLELDNLIYNLKNKFQNYKLNLNDKIKKDLNLIEQISNKKVSKNEVEKKISMCKKNIEALEMENEKINKSIFKFFKNSDYQNNLDKIQEYKLQMKDFNDKILEIDSLLSTLKNIEQRVQNSNNEIEICEKHILSINTIDEFLDIIDNLNKYIAISDLEKGRILNYTISVLKNEKFDEEFLKHICKIKELYLSLSEYDYRLDNNNLSNLYSIILPRNIIKNCFEKICVGEYKVNTVFSKKDYYRVDIFTILYILKKLGFKSQTLCKYIYIDEAQDYNDVELALIQKMEDDSVMNIFGDYKQNISCNSILRDTLKSISKSLDGKFNYYELNENYRNTTNVVDYCNNKLNVQMLGIGISGEDVILNKFLSIDEVIKQAESTESIIITNDDEYLEYILSKSKVKAFSVKDVKGLEFRRVIVIDDGLSHNEKYVAFTRTLGTLEIFEKDN